MQLTDTLNPAEHDALFRAMAGHLVQHRSQPSITWRDWTIRRVEGGANNLVYQASNGQHTLAVKWMIRDDRDRARREFAALTVLHQYGLQIAPRPYWIDHQSFPQPIVIQSWLRGDNFMAPPATREQWVHFLSHFATIHSITPERTPATLAPAVLNANSAAESKTLIQQQLAHLPPNMRPATLVDLLEEFRQLSFPAWPQPRLTLCRVDPNVRNFLQTPHGIVSVDWENGGWGDPAFELANLLSHPSYMEGPIDQWHWMIDTYSQMSNDPLIVRRVWVYLTAMHVWWVVRFARLLHDIPRGRDQRLVERTAGWEADIQEKYDLYLKRAWTLVREKAP